MGLYEDQLAKERDDLAEAICRLWAVFRNADTAEHYTADDLANDFVRARKITAEALANLNKTDPET